MKKVKNLIYVVGLLVVALVCFAFTPNLSNNIVNAYNAPSNVTDFEDVSLTNGNFASNPNQTYLDKSPSGWKLIKESSSATSGVINVGKNFSANASNYQLGSDKNPEKPSSSYDDKVLMINAKNSQGIESQTSQGFVYEDITFDSYSYYEVSVWVKTMDNAVASVYLTGFDEDEYSTENFLNISTTNWKNYNQQNRYSEIHVEIPAQKHCRGFTIRILIQRLNRRQHKIRQSRCHPRSRCCGGGCGKRRRIYQ